VLDAPTIPDSEYDKLFQSWLNWRRPIRSLLRADHAQRVGGKPPQDSTSYHRTPMLSLNNAFADEDVIGFDRRVAKAGQKRDRVRAERNSTGWRSVSGTTAVALYQAHPGRRYIGEDVTANLRRFVDPAQAARRTARPLDRDARDHHVQADFERMNARQRSAAKRSSPPAQNAAAGSLRQLDPKNHRRASVRFFAYGLATPAARRSSATANSGLDRGPGLPVSRSAPR